MKHKILLPAFLILACVMGSSSCKSTQKGNNGQGWILSFQKGACFGRCPVYELGADENGNVSFEGMRFIPKPGKDSARLSKEELKTYRQLVKKAGVDKQPGNLDTLLMDAPITTFYYTQGDSKHQFRYNREIPSEVKEIAEFLNDFALRKGWLEDYNQVMAAKTLFVELKPGVTKEQFLQKFVMFKVNIEEELKTNPVRYVISWDKERIPSNELLNVFRLSDEVEKAAVHGVESK